MTSRSKTLAGVRTLVVAITLRRLASAITLRMLAAAVMLSMLAACSPGDPKFMGSDVTGGSFGRDFRLTDSTGKARSLADFRGKVVVLFFGYTQCPDACPTTLADLAAAMKKLGADAERVQVVFVTVDPERDTPSLLAQYVPAFDPRFLGLYGDAAATEAVAKEFRVFYQKHTGTTPGSYSVDHSAGTFLYDPQGRLRVFMSYGKGADVFAHDIGELLKSAG